MVTKSVHLSQQCFPNLAYGSINLWNLALSLQKYTCSYSEALTSLADEKFSTRWDYYLKLFCCILMSFVVYNIYLGNLQACRTENQTQDSSTTLLLKERKKGRERNRAGEEKLEQTSITVKTITTGLI